MSTTLQEGAGTPMRRDSAVVPPGSRECRCLRDCQVAGNPPVAVADNVTSQACGVSGCATLKAPSNANRHVSS
jgi:hypothetical protein